MPAGLGQGSGPRRRAPHDDVGVEPLVLRDDSGDAPGRHLELVRADPGADVDLALLEPGRRGRRPGPAGRRRPASVRRSARRSAGPRRTPGRSSADGRRAGRRRARSRAAGRRRGPCERRGSADAARPGPGGSSGRGRPGRGGAPARMRRSVSHGSARRVDPRRPGRPSPRASTTASCWSPRLPSGRSSTDRSSKTCRRPADLDEVERPARSVARTCGTGRAAPRAGSPCPGSAARCVRRSCGRAVVRPARRRPRAASPRDGAWPGARPPTSRRSRHRPPRPAPCAHTTVTCMGPVRTEVMWQSVLDAVEAASTGDGGLDVLDLGGGTGHDAVRLAGLGHRVTVVDPSPDALASLDRRAAESDLDPAGQRHRSPRRHHRPGRARRARVVRPRRLSRRARVRRRSGPGAGGHRGGPAAGRLRERRGRRQVRRGAGPSPRRRLRRGHSRCSSPTPSRGTCAPPGHADSWSTRSTRCSGSTGSFPCRRTRCGSSPIWCPAPWSTSSPGRATGCSPSSAS